MGDLTKNISRYEISCKCGCGFDTIDYKVVAMVQDVCDHIADQLKKDRVLLIIHSGCRCIKHNKVIGGAKKSNHLLGRAIDFHIEGIDPGLVYNYLIKRYPDRFGFGNYRNFTHMDSGARLWRKAKF